MAKKEYVERSANENDINYEGCPMIIEAVEKGRGEPGSNSKAISGKRMEITQGPSVSIEARTNICRRGNDGKVIHSINEEPTK